MQKTRNLLKKIMVVAMIAVMALSMVACGGNGGTEGGNTGSAGNEVSGETYEIVVSLTQASEAAHTKMIKEELAKLEEQSNGQLKFTVYDSGTLVKITDAYNAVSDGMADIVFMPNNIGNDTLLLNARLLAMPMFGYTSEEQGNRIYDQLCEEFPEINGECEDNGLVNLGIWFNGAHNAYFTGDVNVSSLADLKGQKLGTADALVGDVIDNSIKATTVYVTSADAYTSLDNGVIDSMICHPLFFRVTGCTDILKTKVQFGDTGLMRAFSMLIMNKAKYDSLPAELQTIIDDGFATIIDKAREIEINDITTYEQGLVDKGLKVIELPEADVEALRTDAEQMHADMIKELEAAGYENAQAIYDRAQELIANDK